VVDRASGATTLGAPGRPHRRATQDERIDGHRRRAQQAGRWQLAPTDDIEVPEAPRRVVEVRAEQEREGFAGQRLGVVGIEQCLEVGGRERGAIGGLEGPRVEDDPDARRSRGRPTAKTAVARVRHGPIMRRSVGQGSRSAATARKSAEEFLDPELDDDHQCLDDDPPTHLGLAHAAVAEGDRDLADPRPAPAGAERHLDLEDVPAGMDAVEWDGRQRRCAPGLEAAGQVVGREA